MNRLTIITGAIGAALLMSSGAFAQVPADPNTPISPYLLMLISLN